MKVNRKISGGKSPEKVRRLFVRQSIRKIFFLFKYFPKNRQPISPSIFGEKKTEAICPGFFCQKLIGVFDFWFKLP